MSLKFNSDQQRIEGSGLVATGSWTNATYSRSGTTVTVVSVGHGLKTNEKIYIDFTSGGATDGNYDITRIDDDSFSLTDSASGTITAGETCSYKPRRSLVLQGSDIIDVRSGSGANEKSSIIVKQDNLNNVRVGIGNVDPEYELDVDGQIRTNRSIISDTAQIINLDIGTIINPALQLRAPNLINYLDSDVTSPTFGTTFYPTADTPDLSDQSRRIATTDFVYKVATNDTGGRVYVSSTIGSDDNDGRSAARPTATIKKAAQIAYGLQKATPDPNDEYVSIIVSGGEYLEDNPITLPRNCSLIGDNLRRVVVRPINLDRHMIKASNETYVNGVVFRDKLQNASDPQSSVIGTWKFAFVFDDKQRLYYEPEVEQIPGQPGEKFRGENIFTITFNSNTGTNSDLVVGYAVRGDGSGTEGTVQSVTFTGPQVSPYSTGTVNILVTSGQDDVFNLGETVYYAATLGAIQDNPNSPPVSPNFGVSDRESIRPELEVISNQIYQHTVNSESETLSFTTADATTDRLTVTNHLLYTGASVHYDDGGTTGGIPGIVNDTNHYVRVIDANTIELYDTWTNAVTTTQTQGRLDITVGTQSGTHTLTTSKIQPETDEIYIERHGLASGDGLYYRSDVMGSIGNLSNNTQYFAYVVDSHHIKLAATQANAVRKNASGADDPIIIDITSSGTGYQRFEVASKLLSVLTVDTSLTTQQTYNGPKIALGTTDYHDYEVGQEVNLYGFPYSPIDFGGSATTSYTQTGSEITVTVSNVGSTEGAAIWGNLTSLGDAGINVAFSTGGATTKSYHITSFTQTGSVGSLPANTALGIGVADYNSSSNIITFLLKAPDSATRSGTCVVNDNLGDLNGRKYVTHRIERADGYSIEYVVRGTYSVFNSALNPSGDQTSISASNYLLASLMNSPFGFTKTTFTHRYRDAAEAIRVNQSFIAEEALGIAKNALSFTVPGGDQNCLDDVLHVLRAVQYDLRYGGNSKTVEAANKYIQNSSIAHVTGYVTESRRVYSEAETLCIAALRSDLVSGTYSSLTPVSNGSVTIDPSSPECANVVSSVNTLFGIVDSVLNTGAVYSGTTTNPETMITEQNSSLYTFPLFNVFLDLPVIEASPYIQNSSLISFSGGSGCEVDGAKVATPNVPRPGLKQNAQGQTVAQFDPQGKSMVANAFTIISFGGTAYNILNDGYTQLVSVFAIFCQDGILCQSGGYASVTNSASNFGTYALRATGFRSEAYTFDVGTITNVANEVDGNGTPTGRQELTVSGTSLTNVPVEDYIIKIDGFTNTNTAIEFIILETEVISGTPGSAITAKITTNTSLDVTETATSTQYSYALGNLSNLVNETIRFHRPSVVNSSSHTWEYSGSGNTYAALPQNGGVGRGTAFEAAEESFGQVYTSGTNEFGDFKVGNFVTIFNRTGAISFVGTVAISELTSIKITGGNITITGFSADDNLGGAFASDSILPTQAAVKDYISNNLGPYLNQPFSTNAVPSALVQLTATGKINIDQLPALRPVQVTSVANTTERLAIEDANAGDIAIETTSTTFNVAPSSVNTSTEEITIVGHGLSTEDGLVYTQGTGAIGGLANNNTYYVIRVDADTIKLAVSVANATLGTAIDLTTQGTGTQIFTTQGLAVSYILENDLESQFLAFTPNNGYVFNVNDIIEGSSTTARGVVTAYNDGRVFAINITNGGSGYVSNPGVTISAPDDTVNGVQATATATINQGVVTTVTVTNPGKGYYNQPTATLDASPGTTGSLAAQIEGRLDVDLANNIKFDAGDFILDNSLTTVGSGTYSQTGTTITITETNHGVTASSIVYLDFTSGTAADSYYTVSVVNNANEYEVTAATSASTTGNVNRKRIIDLSREVNTSASNAANWTQLTSTNIDANNIVSGTIDTDRLANRGTANSSTFLRGDSSWEYAVQSIKPSTSDAIVMSASVTDSSYIESITIVSGGSGYTDGTYQSIPLAGGNIAVSDDRVARATYIVSGGVITSASVVDSGTGYTGDFAITIPSELGGGSSASLTAVKGTINRVFGNVNIDIKKGDSLTSNTSVYGNYGVFKFRKDVANQALANQTEGGFVITNNGEVSIDQGAGSKLHADRLDNEEGADFHNAALLTGTIDPARLSNSATYNINIQGTAANTDTVNVNTVSVTSSPAPTGATDGLQLHLRNNSANSLSDGGTTNGVLTYRRSTTPGAVTQLGFTDNNNLYIRGNANGAGGVNTTYGNWAKIWSDANDGAASGLDADVLDGQQGLWYQTARNLVNIPLTKDSYTSQLTHDALPEVLGTDKYVFENFYVAADGDAYELYIPGYHVTVNSGGNITSGTTYTLYSDSGATNNIGSFTTFTGAGNIDEGTDNTGAIYTLVRGTITFTGNATSKDIYVVGPNPGTKWTVGQARHLTTSSAQIFAVNDNASGAGIELGKSSVSSVPTLDFRSSGSAGDYDVQFRVSGGTATNGQGTLRINAGDVTINGNTVWHAGNDGATSQLDARYLQGAEPATAATADTIAKRGGSGELTVQQLTSTNGVFTNNSSTLSIGDSTGITISKATGNVALIAGKGTSTNGGLRFGNDTNTLNWNGSHLSYNSVYFRSGRLGIGVDNPLTNLHIQSGSATNDGDGSASMTQTGTEAMLIDLPGFTVGETYGSIVWKSGSRRRAMISAVAENTDGDYVGLTFYTQGTDGSGDFFESMRIARSGNVGIGNFGSGTPNATLDVKGQVRTNSQFNSTVAIGTAPIIVTSTTECTNLNAARLQGYSALTLPYFGSTVNVWLSDAGGQERFYFSNNGSTFFRTGSYFHWRSDNNQALGSLTDTGSLTLNGAQNSDYSQTTYALQVGGRLGINVQGQSLVSQQQNIVLRATGDKQWIDTYGILKRNRQVLNETISINNGDSCISGGDITIQSGATVTIAAGGSWSIV